MYYRSPSRIKTLDIVAKAAPFKEQSLRNMTKFCQLARSEGNVVTPVDCAQFLMHRYDWVFDHECDEFLAAWNASGCHTEKLEELETPEPLSQPTLNETCNRINVVMKKDSFTKSTLLCQVHDEGLKFIGDSGAIGRLTADDSQKQVTIDLKGRQYSGQLFSGPTVFFLNTSQAGSKTGCTSQTTARVEVIANEFCHLVFEKDNMLDLVGSYSGDMSYVRGSKYGEEEDVDVEGDIQGGADGDSKTNSKRRRKRVHDDDSNDHSNDNDDDEDYDSEDRKNKKKTTKAVKSNGRSNDLKSSCGSTGKARSAGSRNPKISTITSRAKSSVKKKRKSTKK